MILCWQYTKALLFVISIYNESSGRKISVMIDCLLNTTRQSNMSLITATRILIMKMFSFARCHCSGCGFDV